MPIRVDCVCGGSFAAPESLAGKAVKCPKCGRGLNVPAAGATASSPVKGPSVAATTPASPVEALLEEAGMESVQPGQFRCPSCGKVLPADSVLCVHCGFHRAKGRRLSTRVGTPGDLDDDEFNDFESHGNPLLDKAERDMARSKAQQSRLQKGLPWWVFLLALIGLISFAVAMVNFPPSDVVRTSGWILIGVGSLVALLGWLRILVVAFDDSLLQGLLCVLVPYVLVYSSMKWERSGAFMTTMLIGAVISGGGYALLYFAP